MNKLIRCSLPASFAKSRGLQRIIFSADIAEIYLGCEELRSNKTNRIKIISGRSERAFMTGVLLLSASTVMVKVIGLAYKIPLLSVLGTEGMGYFNSAYEIYALLCIIATAGLPIALSMMVSVNAERGDSGAIRHVYRDAMLLFAVFGTLGGAFMFAFADKMAEYYSKEYGLRPFAGTDNHMAGYNPRYAGIMTDVPIESVEHFMELFRRGDYEIFEREGYIPEI